MKAYRGYRPPWKSLDVSGMTEPEIYAAWSKLTDDGNECAHGKDKTILYRPEKPKRKRPPMVAPSFKPGDVVENTISGWVGVIVRKNPIRNNGYRVEWTDTKGARFASKVTDLSPMNLRLVTKGDGPGDIDRGFGFSL